MSNDLFSQLDSWLSQVRRRELLSRVRLVGLTEEFLAGRKTLSAWQTAVKQELKAAYAQAAIIIRGGGVDALSRNDIGLVGDSLRDQYVYLGRFANQIESDVRTGNMMTDAYYTQRIGLYTLGAVGVAWKILRQDALQIPGVTINWNVSAGEHCQDCLSLAKASPYSVRSLPTVPRAGMTVCRMNCNCELEFLQ